MGPFDNQVTDKNEFIKDIFDQVIVHLRHYEKQKWKSIKREPHNHPMPKNKLCKQAQNRLIELDLDDYDLFFQLKIQGLQRLWGIRDGGVFIILWWDPHHKFYTPRNKR